MLTRSSKVANPLSNICLLCVSASAPSVGNSFKVNLICLLSGGSSHVSSRARLTRAQVIPFESRQVTSFGTHISSQAQDVTILGTNQQTNQ